MLDLSTVRIAFLGFGNMASAMADGWIRSGAVKPEQLGAASRRQDVLEARTKARGMKAFATCEEAARWADVVVVAVKPHLVEGVVKPIRGILKDRLVLSVAVGRLFDFYESILEPGTRHLSTLPNTPVSINEGIVICEARHSMTLDDEAFVEQLFAKLRPLPPCSSRRSPTAPSSTAYRARPPIRSPPRCLRAPQSSSSRRARIPVR